MGLQSSGRERGHEFTGSASHADGRLRPSPPPSLSGLARMVESELRIQLSRALHEQQKDRTLLKRAMAAAYAALLSKYESPAVRRRFALLSAPLMRRLLLSFAESGEVRLPHGLDARELRQWLERLDAVDAHSGLMVDLHYFAGLGIRETALVLDVSRHTIVHDLRCARDWLFSYLGRRSGWGLARRLERE